MENNNMVSFGYIINNYFKQYNIYIPLIQRNYKWDQETAAKLAVDLWKSFKNKQKTYTVGMITLYKEELEKTESKLKMQLIDGQQRIITLFMLLKYIMPNENYFSFDFERDDGISEENEKRKTYLSNIVNSDSWEEKELYTDIIRFKHNYCKMYTDLKENGYEEINNKEFLEYITNNVYFLLHILETEPFDEFMNLNNNKTRFVISDRIKANMMIDSKEKNQKDKVLNLFQNLSNVLFSNKAVWELVQQGYCESDIPSDNEKRNKNKLYPDENRLKLLCCERYGSNEFDVSSILGYEYKKEFSVLEKYYNILNLLKIDLDNENWNSFNAFNCLHKLKKEILFFRMLMKEKEKLEEYLINEVTSMSPFEKACFIESQLGNQRLNLDYIDDNKSIEKEFNQSEKKTEKNPKQQKLWIKNGDEEFQIFTQIYDNYIKEKYNERE